MLCIKNSLNHSITWSNNFTLRWNYGNSFHVKKGQLLVSFDMEKVKAAGYDVTTPLIVTNSDVLKPTACFVSKTVSTTASHGATTSPFDGITAIPFPSTSEANVASFTWESKIAGKIFYISCKEWRSRKERPASGFL